MASPSIRLPFTVPVVGLPQLSASDFKPLFPSALLDETATAQWAFGVDGDSLSSLMSGHVVNKTTASGAIVYSDASLKLPAGNAPGVLTSFTDSANTTFTACGVAQALIAFGSGAGGADGAGGVALFGNRAASGTDNNGISFTIDPYVGGRPRISTADLSGGIGSGVQPSSPAYAAGAWIFWAVAVDAGGVEALIGGGTSSAILTGSFTRAGRALAFGNGYLNATTGTAWANDTAMSEALFFAGVKKTRAQMLDVYAAAKIRCASRGIAVI